MRVCFTEQSKKQPCSPASSMVKTASHSWDRGLVRSPGGIFSDPASGGHGHYGRTSWSQEKIQPFAPRRQRFL